MTAAKILLLLALSASASAEMDGGNTRLSDWFTIIDFYVRSKANETTAAYANESRDCWREKLRMDENGAKQVNRTFATHVFFQAAHSCFADRLLMTEAIIEAFEFKAFACCKHELFQLEPKAAILDGYDDSEWDGEREECEARPCIRPFEVQLAKLDAEVGNYTSYLCNVRTLHERTVDVYAMKLIKNERANVELRNAELKRLSEQFGVLVERTLKCLLDKIAD